MRVDNVIQKISGILAVLGIIGSIFIGESSNAGVGILSGISAIIICILLYGFGAIIESVRNIEDILLKREGAKGEEH